MTLPRRRSLLFILGPLFWKGRSKGQAKALPLPPAQDVDKALSTFKELIQSWNYKQMGFASVEQARRATGGPSYPIYYVRLDQLKKYDPAKDQPDTLILYATQTIHSVVADGEVRASFTLEFNNNAWRAVTFDSPAQIRYIDAARKKISPAASPFVVGVPALHARYVAVREDGAEPGDPHPGGELKMYAAGPQPVEAPPGSSARKILALLTPLAIKTPDKPV
jgi:hypothetical protein